MEQIYYNEWKTERLVEINFISESIVKYYNVNDIILDVGGVPSKPLYNQKMYDTIKKLEGDYRVCDFRGGDYQGNFITYDFKDKKFDIIIFLSSLEHFSQCTESDKVYREKEDVKGFQKAISILKKTGKIFLTVPYGKPLWQKYHQNYDWDLIIELTKGSLIIEKYTYELVNDFWILKNEKTMNNILYPNGVGCFIMQLS